MFGKNSAPSGGSIHSVGLVYVDAENCKTQPQNLMSSISSHHGSKPAETHAYSKWSAKSLQTKKYREAGFRLLQADSGENNADIMMCLDAYQRVRDLADMGVTGNIYICFHGDKGFTHLLEKLRAISGWNSIWVTSNQKANPMIENSASETLRISPSQKNLAKKSLISNNDAPESETGKKDTVDIGEMKELIMQLIGEEEIKSSLLGSKIIEYQKTNGWVETGKEAFNTKFGLPKTQTYKYTISQFLSSKIEISGAGASLSYKVKSVSQSSQKKIDKKSPVKDKNTTNLENGKKDSPDNGELKEVILQLISEDEIRSSLLGSKMIEYQKSNGWSETGKEAFNIKFGLPKVQSYRETISQNLSSEIEVLGQHTSTSYKRKSASHTSQKAIKNKSSVKHKDDVKLESSQKFPRINGFNNSGKGLRFPLIPETLTQILVLNAELEESFSKNERIDLICSKLTVGRSRVNVVLMRLIALNLMESKSPLDALSGLLLRFDSSSDTLGDWTPKEIEYIQLYFEKALESLE